MMLYSFQSAFTWFVSFDPSTNPLNQHGRVSPNFGDMQFRLRDERIGLNLHDKEITKSDWNTATVLLKTNLEILLKCQLPFSTSMVWPQILHFLYFAT